LSPQLEAPETEAPEQPEQSPYGEHNEQLPKQLVDLLRDTIQEFQGQEKFSRRREVRRDRRNRFYEAGFQHLQWSNSGNSGFIQLVPGGTVNNSAGQSQQCPQYMDAYNIFFPYFRIIQSVLTQTLPGVDFQPIDPSNPEDIDKAKTAEDYARLFDRMNDIKDTMGQIVRMMAMSGRTVSWTRTDEDAQRFGYDPPDSTHPKKFQRVTIHGTLETKVPILAREFDKCFLYCFIYEDHDVKYWRDEYPDFADDIKAGTAAVGESQYERYARLGVLNGAKSQSQIGDALSHISSGVHAFLRPAAFTGSEYDAPFEGGGTVKDKLSELFPEGARVCFVGDVYIGSYAECMDDHIDIQFPYQGDGQSRTPFMEAMVVVQDNFNDLCNWIREKVDTGAGSTWIDGTQEEVDAVTSQRAAPNAIRAWKAHPGQALEQSFYKEEEVQIPETLFNLLEFLRGTLPEFLLAALPSLQGGQMSDNKTASGYAQANAQAKGQLAIIWSRMQRMFARIRYQSALAASLEESQSGTITIPGTESDETVSVDMDTLKKGNFGCYPDEDSSFPESTAQKRATLQGLLTLAGQSPMVAQLLDNPDNVEELKRLNGFEELTLLPAEARNKQLTEIEILLTQAPIPPDPMQAQQAMEQHAAGSIAARHAGQPGPPMPDIQPQPSIPVQELDFHQWEFEKCQEWLSSAARRDQDKRGNQAGVQNVILHALQHRAMMQQMMAQQAALAAPPAMAKQPTAPPKPPEKPAPTAGLPEAA
jgi:hypothetical protein